MTTPIAATTTVSQERAEAINRRVVSWEMRDGRMYVERMTSALHVRGQRFQVIRKPQ